MVIAIASDPRFKTLRPTNPFPDSINLPGVVPQAYGDDLKSSIGRKAPGNYDQGKTPEELIPKMRALLGIFARQDVDGFAARLVNAFLDKHSTPRFFEDRQLNHAALYHENIVAFCRNALAAPHTGVVTNGRIFIHQALKAARWDINKMIAPRDLGTPSLNTGSKYVGWGDWSNGLALAADGIQYAYCIARQYCYDSRLGKYSISIRFIFYDVFGLDDEDLRRFGANNSSAIAPIGAQKGITAWWQLQHQHGYAPLVTRIVVDRNYEVAAI